MDILTALISIALLAALTAVLRAHTPLKLCPICVGVSGTWLWMLAARELGWMPDPAILALLIGGSVVGIAYRLERRISADRSGLFLALFILVGFLAGYGVVIEKWLLAVIAAALATSIAVAVRWPRSDQQAVRQDVIAEAEKKLERCCD